MYRVGCVSYLNSKPLIYGLERQPDIRLSLDVPARLLDGMRDERFDVALLPVIDYQKLPDLRILPVGGIASDGPTLTVRIFSPVPIEKIQTLSFDPDSHTSVALAKIILAERYGLHPAQGEGSARLLIGDKVVCDEPRDMPFQLDLGQAWKELTGLPFAFAVWAARGDVNLGDLPRRLDAARERGMKHIDEIIAEHAIPRGWPGDLARQYLTQNLQFQIGLKHLQAIAEFYRRCAGLGLIESPAKPLDTYGSFSAAD